MRSLYVFLPHLHAKSLQPYATAVLSMDHSPPGSSVRGILQAGILEGSCHDCFPIAALFPYCCTVSLYTAPQTWWLKHICYSMVLRPEAYHLAKPRCQLSCASPGGSKEYPFPCLFQYLEAARIPRLAAPPSRGESSPSIVPTLFLPSYPLCLFSFLFPYLRTLVIIWGPHG